MASSVSCRVIAVDSCTSVAFGFLFVTVEAPVFVGWLVTAASVPIVAAFVHRRVVGGLGFVGDRVVVASVVFGTSVVFAPPSSFRAAWSSAATRTSATSALSVSVDVFRIPGMSFALGTFIGSSSWSVDVSPIAAHSAASSSPRCRSWVARRCDSSALRLAARVSGLETTSGIGVSPLLCGSSSLTTSGSSFGCCSSPVVCPATVPSAVGVSTTAVVTAATPAG
ncbi:hypothetical protein PR002_g26138 [Phytophthora rubi]|uniref:Uncharacterized protein n=1 Tax=Phytophthora rubi TaxID=129364 RepID=A0A6A3HVD3_9STRA|nr:hypothetical protein PR002_g26138 [Phytophthora rubi]